MAPCRIRVLVVEDELLLRRLLCAFVDDHDDLEICGQAGDGQEALAAAAQLTPDVVLMDVSMPGLAGDEATRRLTAALPSVQVLAVSVWDDQDVVGGTRAFTRPVDTFRNVQSGAGVAWVIGSAYDTNDSYFMTYPSGGVGYRLLGYGKY